MLCRRAFLGGATKLSRGFSAVAHRIYIACDQPRLPVFNTTKERISTSADWKYHQLQAGHNAMLTAPQNLARIMLA